ncbi:uncharacterized protein [Argopecten irradians]|uniref:uncharacterized protein isoform X1 n=1 Tax=Argopecten irradians TaxID=31199 RepID=UPI00371DAA04
MSSASSDRHVLVLPHMNADGIFIPVSAGDKIEISTIKSQFPQAIGLKYRRQTPNRADQDGHEGSGWMAVAVKNEAFLIPSEEDVFLVTSATATDQARSVLRNTSSLAMNISRTFGSTQKLKTPGTSPIGFNPRMPLTRKQTRETYMNRNPKKPKEVTKSIKCCLIKRVELPSSFAKSLTLSEGIFTFSTIDDEETIRSKIARILNIGAEDFEFLTCAGKTLYEPQLGGERWNGEMLKTNIGQGKLYLMIKQNSDEVDMDDALPALVSSKKPRYPLDHLEQATGTWRSSPDDPIPSNLGTPTREIQQNTRDPPEYQEHHQIPSNSGTPTVVFETRNVRNKLSLSRNNSRRIPGSTFFFRSYVSLFSDEYIQLDSDSGDELPDPAESSRIPNLREELVALKSKLHVADDGNKITKFNINRHDVMDGARRAINRKSFCPLRKMSVKFTDDIGSPEGAVDEGGPKRELLRLLLKNIQFSNIFEGQETQRLLSLNPNALSSGAYKDAGTIISMSIVHGGPAPKFFNQLLFDMMVGRKVHLTLEDVQDIDMKGKIKKLKDCTNLEDIDLNLSSAGLSTIMNISGCWRPVRNLEDRDFLVQDLLHFVVVGRVTEALSQYVVLNLIYCMYVATLNLLWLSTLRALADESVF